MCVQAIRGATSVEADEPSAIYARTTELVQQMLSSNDISVTDLVSVFFTCTPDLTSAFPATAARAMGLEDVPLMCAVEMGVKGAPTGIIRVMMHIQSSQERENLTHVYLHAATGLRSNIV